MIPTFKITKTLNTKSDTQVTNPVFYTKINDVVDENGLVTFDMFAWASEDSFNNSKDRVDLDLGNTETLKISVITENTGTYSLLTLTQLRVKEAIEACPNVGVGNVVEL